MTEFKFDCSHDIEQVECQLSIFRFEENSVIIFYSPALDLSGSGNTENEAWESFEITFNEFMKYTLIKKTLFKELKRLGWTVQKKKKLKSPPLNKLLDSNTYLAEIFENRDFSKFNKPVSLPAYA